MDKKELEKQRNYAVIKSNELIQQSRFKLSVTEQKVIWYIISKVKYEDDDFKYYDFSIPEFCRICNIDDESGGNSELIKDALKTLADKSMYFDTGIHVDEPTLVRWISKVRFSKRKGIVSIRLDEDMKPYLLKLQEEYTSLDLSVALSMKRKYSIRLYEILKSDVWKNKVIDYSIDDLKAKIDVPQDKRFPDFKKDILTPAIAEINEYADFKTTFSLSKTGRAYSHIHFKFEGKTFLENNAAIKAIDKRLNSKENQISFV